MCFLVFKISYMYEDVVVDVICLIYIIPVPPIRAKIVREWIFFNTDPIIYLRKNDKSFSLGVSYAQS